MRMFVPFGFNWFLVRREFKQLLWPWQPPWLLTNWRDHGHIVSVAMKNDSGRFMAYIGIKTELYTKWVLKCKILIINFNKYYRYVVSQDFPWFPFFSPWVFLKEVNMSPIIFFFIKSTFRPKTVVLYCGARCKPEF